MLELNQEPRVDISLEVGSVTESVTVSGQAIRLQTESAVVGQVVDNQYTTQIPLNGRDFTQLLLLSPGTTTRPGGSDLTVGSATGSLGSGIAIGGRDNQNNFTLDGASNNARQFGNVAIKPSIDAIQEFKVQTNSYSAEFGQAAFGQVSLITKSSTNSFHDTLFEFWRNNVFDARNFFLPKASRQGARNAVRFEAGVLRRVVELSGGEAMDASTSRAHRRGQEWRRRTNPSPV